MLFRISVGCSRMLYKSLISLYGSSLAGKSSPSDDLVWHFTPSEDLRRFREYALDAMQQAKVYLLDHLAAAYADTLHEAVAKEAADIGAEKSFWSKGIIEVTRPRQTCRRVSWGQGLMQ